MHIFKKFFGDLSSRWELKNLSGYNPQRSYVIYHPLWSPQIRTETGGGRSPRVGTARVGSVSRRAGTGLKVGKQNPTKRAVCPLWRRNPANLAALPRGTRHLVNRRAPPATIVGRNHTGPAVNATTPTTSTILLAPRLACRG